MDGEAQWYHGLEAEFITGSKPTLTIYQDGEQQGEPVPMSHLEKRDEIHEFIRNLGFKIKSEEEIQKVKAEHFEKEKERRTVVWSRTEYRHQMKEDVDDFRKNVMQVLEEKPFIPRFKGVDLLENNYRDVFGTHYLTFEEKVGKADRYLLLHQSSEL
ncbi:hypothetical protein FisN_20Lu190 [Fistulifera solaris]|uniref:Selenoprotein F/M domain-containing protein n=1 Tax=Fistulifera solaris TaxID=1519565 RepID=A0A1Z5KSB0_FISSO|nr:hypothetical protein FisN_20Lu190 [Fistulifera solaris]|eukprot:GAX28881.1 hypothetical protein FisN_20Lu190 [Fistulifera solaris]